MCQVNHKLYPPVLNSAPPVLISRFCIINTSYEEWLPVYKMPVMIRNNDATELCITKGQEGFVVGWQSEKG